MFTNLYISPETFHPPSNFFVFFYCLCMQVKWRLMVTSCYRRMGNTQKALELYEKIHTDYPDNVECLRYLVGMCKEQGRPYDHVSREGRGG